MACNHVMTVGELIEKLKEFPQDYRVVLYPEEGWMDIDHVEVVFNDYVALMPEDGL